MTRRSTLLAAIVAAAVGVAAPGCGGGDRQDVNQSNEGDLESQGGQSTQMDPSSGITPTGETQPTVTQGEGGE